MPMCLVNHLNTVKLNLLFLTQLKTCISVGTALLRGVYKIQTDLSGLGATLAGASMSFSSYKALIDPLSCKASPLTSKIAWR
jgi:hypothetical protein